MDSWSPDKVHKAFQPVLQRASVYSSILPFFESVYLLQEASVASACPAPLPAPDPATGALPPLQFSQLTVDWPNALQLLGRLCEQASQANPELAAGAQAVARHLDPPGTAFERAFSFLIEARSEDLARTAAELGTSPAILTFLLFNSVWPSIAHHSRAIAQNAQSELETWDKGTCPICGAAPFLSVLDDSGRRDLVCGFCRHAWHAIRIFCPFCGESDSRALSYFFAEGEKAYRVHTCQSCLTYIKTVDTRELNRLCYPPLETILTTHLDLEAQRLGFKSVTPAWLSL